MTLIGQQHLGKARPLIMCLLAGSIVAGFFSELQTENVAAWLTSTSTVTSTYYNYSAYTTETTYYTPIPTTTATISVRYFELDCPLVRVTGLWRVLYQGRPSEASQIMININITNLMSKPIIEGDVHVIFNYGYTMYGHLFHLRRVNPGQTILIEEPMSALPTQFRLSISSIALVYEDVLTQVPVRSVSMTETRTLTMRTTYTTEQVIIGQLSSGETSMVTVILIGLSVIAGSLYWRKRRSIRAG